MTYRDVWEKLRKALEDGITFAEDDGITQVLECMRGIEASMVIDPVLCFDRNELVKAMDKIKFHDARDSNNVFQTLGLVETKYAFYAEPLLSLWKNPNNEKPLESKRYLVALLSFPETEGRGVRSKVESTEADYNCETDTWHYTDSHEEVTDKKVVSWAEWIKDYQAEV